MSKSQWSFNNSKKFYNIDIWGNGYFGINHNGEITVKKGKYSQNHAVPLKQIVQHLQHMNIETPIILRFTDIIQNRISRITRAFSQAMHNLNYSGQYTLIFPIKVNQQHTIINSILQTTPENKFGLEAGSKPELLILLSSISDKTLPIVCNGFKDYEYIHIALIAKKCGLNITIVIEKMIELQYVIEISKLLDVVPTLGVRFRLALTPAGKWSHSGGDKSKFGLNASQLIEMINILRQHNLLHCLQLLHCHQGSQIANIKDIENYIYELTHIYVHLIKLGIPITILDIGGGLAIDYEGSRTRNFNSTNYSLGAYATTILQTIKLITQNNNIPMPHIYSESGRAVVAHHAVFITNILEIEEIKPIDFVISDEDIDLITLDKLYNSFDTLDINEIYSSGILILENIHKRFTQGQLSLTYRANAEQLFHQIKLKLIQKLNLHYRSHRQLYDKLDEELAIKIILNFSIFQSLPDSWAIAQLFPIMPMTHLNQKPTMRAILQDITCDSDGKINNYIDYQGYEPSIKLPLYNPMEPYLIAIFLVGAYQEIMGNAHNLFGSVNTADISLDGPTGFVINKIHHAKNNQQILNQMDYKSPDILNNLTHLINDNLLLSAVEKKDFYSKLYLSITSSPYLR